MTSRNCQTFLAPNTRYSAHGISREWNYGHLPQEAVEPVDASAIDVNPVLSLLNQPKMLEDPDKKEEYADPYTGPFKQRIQTSQPGGPHEPHLL